MSTYRDEAIVLRTQQLGDADRIVTLLTRHHGRVRAVAKGVRKTSSRYGARLEPFGYIDTQIYVGKSLDTITQIESVKSYGVDFAVDYSLWTTGQVLLETAEKLTPAEREPATQQFLLLLGALRALATREHPSALVVDAYLLRAISIEGWAPTFDECAICGELGPHSAFAISGGGSVCLRCKPAGSTVPTQDTIGLMRALVSGDWKVAQLADLKTRTATNALVSAYVQWHLERGLRSLRMVERSHI